MLCVLLEAVQEDPPWHHRPGGVDRAGQGGDRGTPAAKALEPCVEGSGALVRISREEHLECHRKTASYRISEVSDPGGSCNNPDAFITFCGPVPAALALFLSTLYWMALSASTR